MIFDKLIALKISLDLYKNSRNPLKKLIYIIILKTISNKVKVIKKSNIISFEILSEFESFANIADINRKSNVIAREYHYSHGRYAQEIIIKQKGLCNINILLIHKNKSIEIQYPLSPRLKINKTYKGSISDIEYLIPDKNTSTIINSIGSYIYDFTISYMKGEFDNE